MQFYRSDFTKQVVEARNFAIIGVTQNNAPTDLSVFNGARGVIGPRTSGWKMSYVRFYNFPVGTTVMQTCSKCDNILLYTNAAQEYLVDNIIMTNVSGNYLFMNGHKREIIYDTDASLSRSFDGGSASRTSATIVYGYTHLAAEAACSPSNATSKWDNALACDQSVTVRKVMFTNFINKELFQRTPMKVERIVD